MTITEKYLGITMQQLYELDDVGQERCFNKLDRLCNFYDYMVFKEEADSFLYLLVHSHRCRSCNVIWTHSESELPKGSTEKESSDIYCNSHRCPKCSVLVLERYRDNLTNSENRIKV